MPSSPKPMSDYLNIPRCPHCLIDKPNLRVICSFNTRAHNGTNSRDWKTYTCANCGGAVVAFNRGQNTGIEAFYPELQNKVDDNLPARIKSYLQQALDSLVAPAGCLMLCASAVDAMLKEKGYSTGSLYNRIDLAATDHLITKEMSLWAHRVRLDANDQRHSDLAAELPEIDDAKQGIEFTKALAEFLFVLPAKVKKGLTETEHKKESPL